MEKKTYNFQNPEVRQKAAHKAVTSKRPSIYCAGSKKVAEVERKLIR